MECSFDVTFTSISTNDISADKKKKRKNYDILERKTIKPNYSCLYRGLTFYFHSTNAQLITH